MNKKLIALSLLMGGVVAAPALADEIGKRPWSGDSVFATAAVEVTSEGGAGIAVNSRPAFSGDIKAGDTMFTLTVSGVGEAPAVVVLGAQRNQLTDSGILPNDIRNAEGEVIYKGTLLVKLDSDDTYELSANMEDFPPGARESSNAHVMKFTGKDNNMYTVRATASKDYLSGSLVGGIYQYSFIANSYIE